MTQHAQRSDSLHTTHHAHGSDPHHTTHHARRMGMGIALDPTVATARIGADGRVLDLNPRFARATGLLGEALDRPLLDLFGDRLGHEAHETWAELVSEAGHRPGRAATKVVELPASDGIGVACLFEAIMVDDREIVLRELLGDNELDAQLVHFRLAAKLGGFGLWTYDLDSGVWRWHGGRARFIRHVMPDPGSPDPGWLDNVHPDDRDEVDGLIATLTRSDVDEARVVFRIRADDGGWHWLESHVRRLRLGIDGRDVIVGVNHDQTEAIRRRAEADLRLRAERERSSRLAEVSAALIRAVTEDELSAVMLTRAASVFGGTGAVVALIERGRLHVPYGPGISEEFARTTEGIGLDVVRRPLVWAIRTGEPVFVESRAQHEADWPDAHEVIEATGAQAYAMIPFAVAGGQPIGALAVVYDRDHRPGSDERALMRTFGQLAGQAIERIRLQQARAELAEALQRTMLPARLPHVPGLEIAVRYAPARDGLSVGGDWYDVIARDDGTALVAIGDAQGHDVDAAAFMGQVRTTKRAFASEHPDPADVLTRTNELVSALHRDTFASCSLLWIDPATGVCSVGRAGHVPMIVLDPDGTPRVVETPGGPVLGVMEGATYPSYRTTLAPGSTIVLVTDGVVEAHDVSIDAGLERAAACASARWREGVEQIADAVLAAAAATGSGDDAAVVVLRLPPEASGG
ncbi:GAF domain-containing SpoIIE family protein phosphatase [Streptomyces sp. SID3343]|uniref:GAF domain-containing SpoIIE family protein phosphatase n=1 Tax=Streptomyces sp. SID3343 TaxID=2690260 RepID=UPI001371D1AA|nr:GAF domain-containing SpoIIE family protein phosphatase [Streptomyces sp. SID3343]MYW01652.1 SpoIIE family protein phosphatase [Streptomyces sp. SID3343]